MMLTLTTGLIGIALWAAFLGFMLWWVPAPPLIIIVAGVTCLVLYDFVLELRAAGKGGAR